MNLPTIERMLVETIAMDGTILSLAVLEDDRYAIVRDGEVLSVHENDDASLGRAVKEFSKLLDRRGRRIDLHPAMASGWHPHCG